MNFHKASFKAAYGTSKQLPASAGPEVSFAGRSNVGKSSLLNKLMYRKGLAKVSQTPGKTATINFYDVDGQNLVDLPGYGYAKAWPLVGADRGLLQPGPRLRAGGVAHRHPP